MSIPKEIGGYFELECASFPILHDGKALFVNSARNALRLIIRENKISHIYLPFYTCPVVWQAAISEGCQITGYDIDENFYPLESFPIDAFILYTDYFGICHRQVEQLSVRYPRLIVDSAQAFYAGARGWASFNSPRKFFGLPDGGMLFTRHPISALEQDMDSYTRCAHLLKRRDLGANAAYKDFKGADAQLVHAHPAYMSQLTHNLLKNIDYKAAALRRCKNFLFIHQHLAPANQFDIELHSKEVPMVYPFWTDDLSLRQKLISQQIYIPSYWPINEKSACMGTQAAQDMCLHIIPIPIDQRYDVSHMQSILSHIKT